MGIHSLDDLADVRAAALRLEGEIRRWLDGAGGPDRVARARRVHAEALDLGREEPLRASELLRTEAEPVRAVDPRLAVHMLVDAASAALLGGDPAAGVAAAARARELAVEDEASAAASEVALGTCLLLAGDAAAGERLVRDVLRRGAARFEGVEGALRSAVGCLYWLEEYALAADLLDRLIAEARAAGAPSLPIWLDTRAAVDVRHGRWSAARATSQEALRVARALGQRVQEASVLTTLARIAGARGDEARCRRDAAAALALAEGNDLLVAWAASALGLLELGLGRLEEAAAQLELVHALGERRIRTDPATVSALGDLVEAYHRLGRRPEARAVFALFEAEALAGGRAWAAAAAHRYRALLGPAADAPAEFERALAVHDRAPVPFERARTELLCGEVLRRARRRRDARVHLQAALGTFDRLGARPWAERARRELAATRRRAPDAAADPAALLTPHELQVAARAAQGLTNREIAAALFVAERTVEYHLTNVYAKLGVRSRVDLARLLPR